MSTFEPLAYKAVLFDLDGVLIDACEWHRLALNQALQELTGKEISLEDHHEKYNGLPTKVKLKKLGITDNELIEKINARKQELTLQYIQNQQPDKDKIELLSYLQNKGILIACVTNSIKQTTVEMLQRAGIIQYFNFLVTNEDITYPKPNSEGYVDAMVAFSSFPRETIIVEDSDKGFEAAKNTGATVIRVKGPSEVTRKLFETYYV